MIKLTLQQQIDNGWRKMRADMECYESQTQDFPTVYGRWDQLEKAEENHVIANKLKKCKILIKIFAIIIQRCRVTSAAFVAI